MRKRWVLRTALVALFLFSILPLLQTSKASERASVQEILSNPDSYDGQEVTLQGKATKVKAKVSKRGNEYTTFTLTDKSGKGLTVFTWGNPGIRDGQRVTVIGIYQKVKKVGRYTFYNEVEAKDIK